MAFLNFSSIFSFSLPIFAIFPIYFHFDFDLTRIFSQRSLKFTKIKFSIHFFFSRILFISLQYLYYF